MADLPGLHLSIDEAQEAAQTYCEVINSPINPVILEIFILLETESIKDFTNPNTLFS